MDWKKYLEIAAVTVVVVAVVNHVAFLRNTLTPN